MDEGFLAERGADDRRARSFGRMRVRLQKHGLRGRERAHRSQGVRLADLMERYVGGDRGAFDQLYRAIEPRVRGQIQAKIGRRPQSDDLVQLTMLRAHLGRHGYVRPAQDADTALVAWFCAIARNIALNSLRTQRREWLRFDECVDPVAARTPEALDDPERLALDEEHHHRRRSALRTAIGHLPPAQRAVLELHRLQGLPMAEVSRRLGIRDGTARVRAHRAYASLRALIGG
jgi:RNA polymerase sigma-70 factor (ECF subfamily)